MAKRGQPAGAAVRAGKAVIVDTVQQVRARDGREAQLQLGEIDLEFQQRVSGTAASSIISWAFIEIEFEHDLFYAPGQRDSELTIPHFTYGSSRLGGPAVGILASVFDWTTNEDNGAIIGATVKWVALSDDTSHFEALLHMTFHGWGALREPDSDLG